LDVSKGAYHLLELASPKELVLIGLNGKVKAGPRDYSSNHRKEYTQELTKQHGGFNFLTFRQLSLAGGGRYSVFDYLDKEFVFFFSYCYFFSAQIRENYALLRIHGSSPSMRWLQELFYDNIHDI